eukprot:CAMPEP_0179267046 /NCGR_PEP_ID=MMETSP0797-20121207/29726_1 /TAXON_ID=47934 /ORGANISM="Dinophysis acuminata, Strain DAEP01" /LENGTH=363 /DNA_ID=CAMNT_0020975291 /DNA_START=125 /DNA_END=1213 /DNA_ORIENTATION=+
MPRKERPAPLADSIFQAKLGQHQLPNDVAAVPEEIPVHNTFIQFGSQDSPMGSKKHLATAPAWVGGPFIEAAMQSAVASDLQVAAASHEQQEEHETPVHAADGESSTASSQSPKKLASPKKVPVMRYSLSASSARAAGYPGSSAVVTSYEPDGSPGADGDSEQPPPPRPNSQVDEDDEGEDDDGEDDDDAEGESGEEAPRRRAPRGPLAPPGPLPSMGSSKHNDGLCKRCCFYPKGRCNNGYDCEFCHFEHEKRKRKKKKKSSKVKDSDSDGAQAQQASAARSGTSPTGSTAASAPAAGPTPTQPAAAATASPATEPAKSSSAEATFQAYDASAAGGAPDQPLGPLRGPPAGWPLTAPPPLPP